MLIWPRISHGRGQPLGSSAAARPTAACFLQMIQLWASCGPAELSARSAIAAVRARRAARRQRLSVTRDQPSPGVADTHLARQLRQRCPHYGVVHFPAVIE